MVFVTILITTCSQDESTNNSGSGNSIQQNAILKQALSAAGISTYDGNTPPNVEGSYTTTPMLCDKAWGSLSSLKGQYMNSIFKLYSQTSDGKISFAEQIQSGMWGAGKGCFITGSGQNFTLWIENNLSNGAATCFVLVGTVESGTGNFINCRTMTVYTKKAAASSINVGDWYSAYGKEPKIGQTNQCACSFYTLSCQFEYVPYGATKETFKLHFSKWPNYTECKTGYVNYTFSNGLPTVKVTFNPNANGSLQDDASKKLGYYSFTVPIPHPAITVTANISLTNGSSCTNFSYVIAK